MKTIALIMLWVYRRQVGRFLLAGSRFVAEYCERLSAEREARKADKEDHAGPHGGFDPF